MFIELLISFSSCLVKMAADSHTHIHTHRLDSSRATGDDQLTETSVGRNSFDAKENGRRFEGGKEEGRWRHTRRSRERQRPTNGVSPFLRGHTHTEKVTPLRWLTPRRGGGWKNGTWWYSLLAENGESEWRNCSFEKSFNELLWWFWMNLRKLKSELCNFELIEYY